MASLRARRSTLDRPVFMVAFCVFFAATSLRVAGGASDEVDAEDVASEARVRVEVDLAAHEAPEQFYFSDPSVWDVIALDDRRALELKGPSTYKPPHRSPLAIALLKTPVFTDVTVTAELQQTGREYGHRDLCLFFGFASKDRFYYTHLATTPDANAHNVFLVDGAARRNLLPPQESGVVWGTDVRHQVRLERRAATGLIRVFFDDMDKPILEVVDRTIGAGRVGFGSFDDTGRFSNIVVEGTVEDAAVGDANAQVGESSAPPVAPVTGDGDAALGKGTEPAAAPTRLVVSPGNPFEG